LRPPPRATEFCVRRGERLYNNIRVIRDLIEFGV